MTPQAGSTSSFSSSFQCGFSAFLLACFFLCFPPGCPCVPQRTQEKKKKKKEEEEKEEKEEEEEEDVYGVRKASTSASASARKVTQHTGVGTTQQRHDQHDNDTAAAGYDWEAASKVLCARLDSMLAAAASIPPQRMQAFNRTVINSIGYHCHATRALVATQAAASAYSAGCSPCAAANLTTALAHLNAIEDIQHFAEGADFRGLFGFDDLTCNPRARRAVQGALEKLTIGAEGQARGWAYGADTISCQGYDLM